MFLRICNGKRLIHRVVFIFIGIVLFLYYLALEGGDSDGLRNN